jgi:dienelactone hydrolase
MRVYEVIFLSIVALLGLACVVLSIFGLELQLSHGWPTALVALASLVFMVYVVRQGPRWQMAPAYVAFVALTVAFSMSPFGMPNLLISLTAFALLAVAATLVLCYLLPMFRFAPLTGPHKVGTSIHHLTDTSRQDQSPSGHRELMIQLWYPAAPSRNKFAPYRRAAETTRTSSYQAVLRTRSRLDAPVADGIFPVLLFNPAWNGRRTQNTFLTEELASYGFVVAAIDHTYNSEPVAFPDGRVVWANHIREMEEVSSTTPAEIQRIGNAEVERQVLDCRFVLDSLALWHQQQGSRWYGHLDTGNAGALGHSLGGAVAVECWATDPHVQAAMNMDGWTFGTQASTGERQPIPTRQAPLLFLYESNYSPFPEPAGKSETEHQVDLWDAAHVRQLLTRYGGYILKIDGANHMNFTDRAITSPLRKLAGGGPIDPRLAHRIIRDYAVNFFNQALRGQPSILLNSQSRYPEVTAPGIEPQP